MTTSIQSNTEVTDVRVTKYQARYALPWYRKLMLKLFGKSHFIKHEYPHHPPSEENDIPTVKE
jgi:hypothetical protein